MEEFEKKGGNMGNKQLKLDHVKLVTTSINKNAVALDQNENFP